MPEKPAYFSRFAVKFAEILGAGIATAVSGYLVAHLGGYLSWPTQAPTPTVAVEAAPTGSAKTPDRPRNRASASAPAASDIHAASAHDEHGKEPAPSAAKPAEVSAPATAGTAVSADSDEKRSRGGTASRKPAADAHAVKSAQKETAEAKPASKEPADAKTAKDTAEAKAHEQEAVEDQVRAALANVDASRTPAPNAPAPAPSAPQTAALPQPQPQPIPAPSSPTPSATAASTATSAAPPVVVPPAAPPLDIQNAAAATVPSVPAVASAAAQQQPPAEPGSLNTVEIKSRPVAGVGDTSAAAQEPTQAENDPDGKAKGETGKSFFSAITHLPDLLRTNAHAPSGDPPRPPMPVGE